MHRREFYLAIVDSRPGAPSNWPGHLTRAPSPRALRCGACADRATPIEEVHRCNRSSARSRAALRRPRSSSRSARPRSRPITLHGAVQFNDDHAFNRALVKFQELTAKYYGKPINFVLHKNSELGLEKDYFAFMNQGISVDYGIVSPAHMSTFSKAAPFIDAPFLFRDLDHWNKVLDADTLKPIADEVNAKGDVMLIGFAGGGTRNIFANKPVRNLAEMKGLKVRVQGAPIWSKTFAAIGMSPTVIAYDEIYNAIQNGVINAGENEAAGVEAMKFYEVGPNLNMTQHAITIRPICFSGKTFKKLPPDLQAAILKAGKEAGHYGRQIESGEDSEEARRARGGRQAEEDPVRRPRADEEARGPGDGRVREGNRRRRDLHQDQLDVARRHEQSGGGARFRRTFFAATRHDFEEAHAQVHRRLLPAAQRPAGRERRHPDRSGHAADDLALHRADPRVDLDRGDGALPVHLDGDAGRDDRRARRHALRRRRLAGAEAARQRAAADRLDDVRAACSRWCSSGTASSSSSSAGTRPPSSPTCRWRASSSPGR